MLPTQTYLLFLALFIPFINLGQTIDSKEVSQFQSFESSHSFIERSMRYNSGWDLDYTDNYSELTQQLINSGNILYHPSTQLLLDSILQLLTNNSTYKIFLFRTNQLLPFATEQGQIYISTGLIAKTKSTDELAFFIAREIVRINNRRYTVPQLARTVSYEEKLTAITNDRLENELFLDSVGVSLMVAAGMNTKDVDRAIHLMEKTHLTFSEQQMQLNYFNSSKITVPPAFFFITKEEEQILLTYPEAVNQRAQQIQKRRGAIAKWNEPHTHSTGKKISTLFDAVQLYCKKEFIRQDIIQGNYIRAIHSIFILEEATGETLETDLLKAHLWYGFSLSKLDIFNSSQTLNYSHLDQHNAKFYLAMNRATAPEIVSLALRNVRDLQLKHPTIREIQHLWDDMTSRIYSNFRINLHQFSRTSTEEILATNPTAINDSTFHLYAIADIVRDTSFWNSCQKKRSPITLERMDRIVIYPCINVLRKNELDTNKTSQRQESLKTGIININEHFRYGDYSQLSLRDQSTIKQVFSQLYAQTDYAYTIPVMNTEDILSIDSYGEYIMIPFFQSEFRIRPKKYYLLSIFVVSIPFIVPEIFLKSYHSSYGMILIHRSTGKLVKSEYHDFNEPLSSKIMLNRIYNSLYEINYRFN